MLRVMAVSSNVIVRRAFVTKVMPSSTQFAKFMPNLFFFLSRKKKENNLALKLKLI